MFEHEVRSSGFSVPLFMLQMFLVPLGVLLFGLFAATSLEDLLGIRGSDLIAYISFSFVGFVLGYSTQTAIPRSLQSGGVWVWIAPVCILGYGVLDEFSRHADSVVGGFFLTRPGFGPAGVIGQVLFTLPALGTCFYSIGITIANRPARTRMGAAFRKAILRSPVTALAKMF